MKKRIWKIGLLAVGAVAVIFASVLLVRWFLGRPVSGSAEGTQTVVIEGFDWGPAVTKTILELDTEIDADSVSADSFTVSEKRESLNGLPLGIHLTSKENREVTAAYACDATGTEVAGSSQYIALELAYGPSIGSPFCYGLLTSVNTYCNPYELTVKLTKDSTLTSADGTVLPDLAVEAAIDFDNAFVPQLQDIDTSGSFTGADGKTLSFAAYAPADDGAAHPLVIWLHGAGEGGTDPTIAILGNKVTALFGQEFQETMGGAYVLCPQTSGFWMTYNEDGDWDDNPGTDSVYLETLMELIESYVSQNPAIDPDRIYVGGCSNGGYMTMDLILNYPETFAAAYPICESYLDTGLSDTQLEAIKDMPIWFVWAANDETVDPTTHEQPTVARLKAMGASVHTTIFEDVHDTTGLYQDTDGLAYQYEGHWSWLYFFNNECEENDVNLWQWLAQQSR